MRPNPKRQEDYHKFDQIDGAHPLQEQVEDFCVLYHVRPRDSGKVAYFNFDLAREMGLVAANHPHKLNKALEGKLLETFGIVIINEYDLRQGEQMLKRFSVRPKKFMATRYLQLQHPSKQGKTSGDGRSIWNGHFKARGVTWDISSCGTGATCLSPATATEGKFFKTGDPAVAYGCGHANLLDGISSSLMSEIFNGNGVKTERILCVIEYSDQRAITVRVGKNLLRPSHFFRYLKQGQHKQLGQIADYYIDRQIANKEWPELKGRVRRYDYLLKKMNEIFATTSAQFETEYIFCWMEWDGDNILMDGGIIDYGSVRQFGLYHHEYRYDDADRMSTTLTEQKHKAKYMVKTFAQLVDFLKTGQKKNLREFDHHPCLNEFDRIFREVKRDIILKKVGFTRPWRDYLCQYHGRLVESFLQGYYYFESYKSQEGLVETEDGITRNAIFSMRDLLRIYPRYLLDREEGQELIKFEDFLACFASSYASDGDLERSPYKFKQARDWQLAYQQLAGKVAQKFHIPLAFLYDEFAKRAQHYNKYARITGDSLLYVAQEFIRYKKKVEFNHYTTLVEQFIKDQIVDRAFSLEMLSGRSRHRKFISKINRIVVDYREGL